MVQTCSTSVRVGQGLAALFLLGVAGLTGCIASGQSRLQGQRVTDVPRTQAEADTFMARPTVASVKADNFDKLWQAMYRVTRNAGFRPDRENYRLGIFTTRSVVSGQIFEPWRHDTGSFFGRLESTLATVRRTVRWDVTRNEDNTFIATPRVLVERYSVIEHRVTFSAQYQEIFALTREEQENMRLQSVDPAAFAEEPVPAAYWYATGRDESLEKRLARDVENRL